MATICSKALTRPPQAIMPRPTLRVAMRICNSFSTLMRCSTPTPTLCWAVGPIWHATLPTKPMAQLKVTSNGSNLITPVHSSRHGVKTATAKEQGCATIHTANGAACSRIFTTSVGKLSSTIETMVPPYPTGLTTTGRGRTMPLSVTAISLRATPPM